MVCQQETACYLNYLHIANLDVQGSYLVGPVRFDSVFLRLVP